MRTNLSQAQWSTCIGIVARISIPEARKTFLERLDKQLPAKGKVSEAMLLQAVDGALKSFPPGAYCGDAQGAYPPITEDLSLKEAALLYERMCRERGAWAWPPIPSLTPEQQKAKADSFAALSPEEQGAAYESTLSPAYRAEQAKHQAELADLEQEYGARPWPISSASEHASDLRRGGGR